MCGIAGVAAGCGERPRDGARAAARVRDAMTHRGPDGAGLLDLGAVVLAHRRLAVVDLSPTGEQPMWTADAARAGPRGDPPVAPRVALVYNGELYNDAELRRELTARGVRFRGPSDAETVLEALAAWGIGALARMRGMYALAWVDTAARTLTLARDPLGIKPLCYARIDQREVVFASEAPAVLAHPDVRASPDLAGVSAYLTTIRTTLGERTMFLGVHAVRPGEVLTFDLARPGLPARREWTPWPGASGPATVDTVREAVRDSVRRHLRADVPVCCLLSGGLDSSIIAAECVAAGATMSTYCSGTPGEGDDFRHAAQTAGRLGLRHAEAPVSRGLFRERWAEMVRALGVPLSTPNEVAINEVARRLRADRHVVALSGEGADELFGGYDVALGAAAAFERGAGPTLDAGSRGRFQLESAAWVPVGEKAGLVREDVWRRLEGDAALVGWYEEEFRRAADGAPADSPLQAHVRFQRRVNLTGLLGRLDTAMMLAGVEGRTPLADVEVAALAESLAMPLKFEAGRGVEGTKVALRRAFGPCLPAEVLTRPKASFPLPFREWIEDHAPALWGSTLVHEIFSPAAIELVRTRPREHWRAAWPMVNVAMWATRWWA